MQKETAELLMPGLDEVGYNTTKKVHLIRPNCEVFGRDSL